MRALFKPQLPEPVFESLNYRVEWPPFVNNSDTIDLGLLRLGEMNRNQNKRS